MALVVGWSPVIAPVLSSGSSFARTVGHHLLWMLMWIALWRGLHRFGWLIVCVIGAAVLLIGALVSSHAHRTHSSAQDQVADQPIRADIMSVQLADCDNRVRFEGSVVLTKREAFEACDTCADVERALRLKGLINEAGRLSSLFDLIEGRLVGGD